MVKVITTKVKNLSMSRMIAETDRPPRHARFIAGCTLAVLLTQHAALGVQTPVNLGTAGNYVVLAKSGISTVPPAAVTGNLGVSPITSTAITGFSLILDSTGQFSTSAQVTGNVYAPDYASPTPANLTTAVGDMEAAYTDAAGRTLPDQTELGSGDIGGMTLTPGLYKSTSSLEISSGNLTLDAQGNANAVFIFQMASTLTTTSGLQVILSGGANPANIFWQVGSSATLGTGSVFQGNILASESITLTTGATLFGRALASNGAVTLDSNLVGIPAVVPEPGTVMLFALGFGLIARHRPMNRAA